MVSSFVIKISLLDEQLISLDEQSLDEQSLDEQLISLDIDGTLPSISPSITTHFCIAIDGKYSFFPVLSIYKNGPTIEKYLHRKSLKNFI